MAERLQEQQVDATTALRPILDYHQDDHLLLVHPAWLYGARAGTAFILALGAANMFRVLDEAAGVPVFFGVLGIGLYLMQWNRYGGPWHVKSVAGYAGLLVLVALFSSLGIGPLGPLGFMGPVGWALAGVLVLLPLAHPLRARKGRPVPRYSYHGTEPLVAIDRLRQEAESRTVRSLAWALVGGVIVFLIVAELSRVAPDTMLLFDAYLLAAFAFVANPLLVSVGLRMGRQQVESRHKAERLRRVRLYRQALVRLEAALVRRPAAPLPAPAAAAAAAAPEPPSEPRPPAGSAGGWRAV